MNAIVIYSVKHIVMKNTFYPKLKSTFDHFLYQNASRDTPQSGQNCQKKPYKNKFHTIHCPENFTQRRTSHEKVI